MVVTSFSLKYACSSICIVNVRTQNNQDDTYESSNLNTFAVQGKLLLWFPPRLERLWWGNTSVR